MAWYSITYRINARLTEENLDRVTYNPNYAPEKGKYPDFFSWFLWVFFHFVFCCFFQYNAYPKNTVIQDWQYSFYGRVWSGLPWDVMSKDSMKSFKKKLETYFSVYHIRDIINNLLSLICTLLQNGPTH